MFSSDTNLIKRIRNKVSVSSSQHWSNWTADKAIDFVESTEAKSCSCCSGSYHEYRPGWWRINLGDTYPIESIVFIGRSDGIIHINYHQMIMIFNDFLW